MQFVTSRAHTTSSVRDSPRLGSSTVLSQCHARCGTALDNRKSQYRYRYVQRALYAPSRPRPRHGCFVTPGPSTRHPGGRECDLYMKMYVKMQLTTREVDPYRRASPAHARSIRTPRERSCAADSPRTLHGRHEEASRARRIPSGE